MKKSLEYSCEEFFIALFRADPRLSGMEIVHFDEERIAKHPALIMQAKQQAHELAGPGGYNLDISVEYRSKIGTPKEQNDIVAAALQDLVFGNSVPNSTLETIRENAGLRFILVKDESTSDRSNEDNLRKWTYVFPVQADLL